MSYKNINFITPPLPVPSRELKLKQKVYIFLDKTPDSVTILVNS